MRRNKVKHEFFTERARDKKDLLICELLSKRTTSVQKIAEITKSKLQHVVALQKEVLIDD